MLRVHKLLRPMLCKKFRLLKKPKILHLLRQVVPYGQHVPRVMVRMVKEWQEVRPILAFMVMQNLLSMS